MNFFIKKRLVKFVPYAGLFLGWNYINYLDKDQTKKTAFNKGHDLSQKFKKYKAWDIYVEPFIINQFSFLFGVSNSFIEGLISDNGPDKYLETALENMKEEVEKDVEQDITNYKKHT